MKPIINHLAIAHYLAGLNEISAAKGIRLQECHDFEELKAITDSIDDRLPLTPMFDPKSSTLTHRNGFWIKGTNEAGEIVHLQAARMDDLTGVSLAEHLESLSAFYSDRTRGAAPSECCFSAASMARRITGTVCYHGEVWLKGGPEGYRGQGLSSVLPRAVLALALAKWAPDFIYGLAWEGIVKKGIALQYGYHNTEPHGVMWNLPMDEVPFDGWLIWLTRRELIDIVSRRP